MYEYNALVFFTMYPCFHRKMTKAEYQNIFILLLFLYDLTNYSTFINKFL